MRKIRKVSAIFLFVILSIMSFSCSLKYGENVNTESVVPEFVFDNVELKEYENKELKAQVKSEKLEQYKDSSETYAYKIEFTAFDDYQRPETVGSCDFLAADTDKEVYTLYNNIEVESKKEKSTFFANMLRWNSKTEQLVSNRDDEVVIQKDDAVIKGKGFSASGITKTFRFSGKVEGDIKTKNGNEEDNENAENTESSEIENTDENESLIKNETVAETEPVMEAEKEIENHIEDKNINIDENEKEAFSENMIEDGTIKISKSANIGNFVSESRNGTTAQNGNTDINKSTAVKDNKKLRSSKKKKAVRNRKR